MKWSALIKDTPLWVARSHQEFAKMQYSTQENFAQSHKKAFANAAGL
jgi:hypothetical protein